MRISEEVTIHAPKEVVWGIITDIEGSEDTLSAVKNIEIIERPDNKLTGLKWKETREMYGKEATETMWISDAKDPSWYEVKSLNHGVEYCTRMAISETDDNIQLTMEFEGIPKTVGAKIMSVFVLLFKGATKKALKQDLNDIKAAAEARN